MNGAELRMYINLVTCNYQYQTFTFITRLVYRSCGIVRVKNKTNLQNLKLKNLKIADSKIK